MKQVVSILLMFMVCGCNDQRVYSDRFTEESVKTVCNSVADWQINHPGWHLPTDWTNAALYSGLAAWAEIGGEKYYNYLEKKGDLSLWSLGLRKYHADHHAVGWYYLELYRKYGKDHMIKKVTSRFDWILDNQPEVSLEFSLGSQKRWSWCDALFMSPPVWINLADVTGDSAYLDYANKEWWNTTEYLYDTEENLYYRDSRYFDKREANGEKVFWARGNGWVFAGLARLLKYFPETHPDRIRYEILFREMAGKIRTLQDGNGFWHTSLLDPEAYPNPETSSTGLFCYGFAAGIDMGLLDQETYLPVVKKAWPALVSAVHENGKLGWVQPVGENPQNTSYDDTEVFGVGAFLLAGTEIYKLIEKDVLRDNPLQDGILSEDGGWCWFSDPRAVSADNQIITGWVTEDGSIVSAFFSPETNYMKTDILHSRFEKDDHDNPAFAVLNGNRIAAFYTRHAGASGIHMRIKEPEEDWGKERVLELNDEKRYIESGYFENRLIIDRWNINRTYTYCNPLFISDEGESGRLFLFWRGLDYKPNYAWSDDQGETWTMGSILISAPDTNGNQRPYAKYFSNGKDKLHIIFTDGHPRDEEKNSVYYIQYHDGYFRTADGQKLAPLGGAPICPTDADKVYDGSEARAWIWDVKADKEGKPAIVYSVLPDKTDHKYYYATLVNEKWVSSKIADAGPWFPETPLCRIEREPHYSGGIVIDPLNIARVYYSANADNTRFELFSAQLNDSEWIKRQITADSLHNNVRPCPVSLNNKVYLLWMENIRYVHYTDYLSRIRIKIIGP